MHQESNVIRIMKCRQNKADRKAELIMAKAGS